MCRYYNLKYVLLNHFGRWRPNDRSKNAFDNLNTSNTIENENETKTYAHTQVWWYAKMKNDQIH